MNKNPITKRQGEVLLFIKAFDKKHQIKPTRSEIAFHFNFNSKNASNDHLKYLEAKGYLRIFKDIARGIVITPKGKKYKGEALSK